MVFTWIDCKFRIYLAKAMDKELNRSILKKKQKYVVLQIETKTWQQIV